MTVLNAQECDIEPLTRIEENALRNAAGYVCKNVARKLKNLHFLTKEKEDLIHCVSGQLGYSSCSNLICRYTTDEIQQYMTYIGWSHDLSETLF